MWLGRIPPEPGFLKKIMDRFTCQFIGVREKTNTFVLFKRFFVPKGERAILRATALGLYFAELNGRRVGDAYLTPGWTSYRNLLQVQEYDVTDLLCEGENELALTVNDGWFCGRLSWASKRCIYGPQSAVCAELCVGGTRIATDESWQARESHIRFSGIYDGETQDLTAETAPLHEFDRQGRVYEGCMPIEVLARRGTDAIRFGPMKPVGLRDPSTGHRPWAVLQLRAENAQGSLYNLVGFQTNLKFGEQRRVFGMIPALARAEYARYGVMHRNTFLDSPRLLTPGYHFREEPRLLFAGQMTGVEGYMESAASGIVAGKNAARMGRGLPPLILPRDTMIGALAGYISDPGVKDFQPMGANFGILPPLAEPIRDKRLRYAALAQRALASLEAALEEAEK